MPGDRRAPPRCRPSRRGCPDDATAAASKTGANDRHGAHHGAQKSTIANGWPGIDAANCAVSSAATLPGASGTALSGGTSGRRHGGSRGREWRAPRVPTRGVYNGSAADLRDQRRRRMRRGERNRHESSAGGDHFRRARRRVRRVVAALDQHVGEARRDELARRVGIERDDEVDRLERGQHGHPVRERIERTVAGLAEAPHRSVGIDRDDERRAQRARLVEAGDVPAVQHVEHAVGEHERTRQRADAVERVAAARRSSRGSAARVSRPQPSSWGQLVYSNSLTTRTTSDVDAATSAAASPSVVETSPSRYTTPRSVTTFTFFASNFFDSTRRAFTFDVM